MEATRLLVLVLAVFACPVCCIFSAAQSSQQNQRQLTDDTVVSALVGPGGLSEDSVLRAIQECPTQFNTSSEALSNLRSAGISETILNAMEKTRRNAMPGEVVPPSVQKKIDVTDVPASSGLAGVRVRPLPSDPESLSFGLSCN